VNDRAIYNRLKSLPPWQKAEAIRRFSLLRGWQNMQARRKGGRRGMTKPQYCSSKGINYKTFLKWELNFKRYGVEALISKCGEHRKGKSKYDKDINYIDSAFLGPAKTFRELYVEFSNICGVKKMEIPSTKTFRRILKNSDLWDLLVEVHGKKGWIKLSAVQGIIEVDLNRPIACIERMEKRLKSRIDAPVLIQLMRLRLEKYVVNRRREELYSLTQCGETK
jgi:hypothetical protein